MTYHPARWAPLLPEGGELMPQELSSFWKEEYPKGEVVGHLTQNPYKRFIMRTL